MPAGLIGEIDSESRWIFVDRSQDVIKNAPEYDEERFDDPGYRDELRSYYQEQPRSHRRSASAHDR